MPYRHRIFLAPIRADVELAAAHEHWTTRHGAVFAATPGLRGYMQNRAPADQWSGYTHVCAETWFDDGDAERAGFGSDHYRASVEPDEQLFVDRERAWTSRVSAHRHASGRREFRLLAFGHTEHTAAPVLADWDADDVDSYELARRPPAEGGRR